MLGIILVKKVIVSLEDFSLKDFGVVFKFGRTFPEALSYNDYSMTVFAIHP
jgi:hypothetical protein